MRSPARLTAKDGAFLVIDMQERLLAVMKYGEFVAANCHRLIQGSELLGVPIWATEQYPEGLGPTVPLLRDRLPQLSSKRTFHACEETGLVARCLERGIRHVTLSGVEAHVCVAQTALELMAHGFTVQVVADAVTSRSKFDWEIGLRRLEGEGAIVSTTEAVLFEWMETAACPAFKSISALVRDFVPPTKSRKPRPADSD